jgi:hypothetical protein
MPQAAHSKDDDVALETNIASFHRLHYEDRSYTAPSDCLWYYLGLLFLTSIVSHILLVQGQESNFNPGKVLHPLDGAFKVAWTLLNALAIPHTLLLPM